MNNEPVDIDDLVSRLSLQDFRGARGGLYRALRELKDARARAEAAEARAAALQTAIEAAVNYCNEADSEASRGRIGGVILPWAGTIRHLLAAGRSVSPSILPGIVERIQWAARQIEEAQGDSRLDDAARAWLRTIWDTLMDGSGELDAIKAAAAEFDPADPSCSVCGKADHSAEGKHPAAAVGAVPEQHQTLQDALGLTDEQMAEQQEQLSATFDRILQSERQAATNSRGIVLGAALA